MPRGYSRDLRERLLQAVASGLSVSEIATRTGVSAKSIRRWREKAAVGQSLEPGRSTGRPRVISPDLEAQLRDQVTATPDATLAEHCTVWSTAGHASVSTATMSRQLARQDLPLKKRP